MIEVISKSERDCLMQEDYQMLHLEFDVLEARMVREQLNRAGVIATVNLVRTKSQFKTALKTQRPGLILADYGVPGLSGRSVLKLAKQFLPDVPLVFVSDKLDDGAAIETLRLGANDFVFKGNLERLAPCIDRALSEARERAQRTDSENALRESEKKYRTIVETSLEGIWVLDQNAFTTFVNERMAEMLGYSVNEMTGRSLYDFMDSEGSRQASRRFEARKRGIREHHEFRFIRKDGSDLWTMISTNPLVDAEGRFSGALGMITDITDRKEFEEQLALHKTALKAAANGVVITIPDGTIIWANPAFTTLTGYESTEVIGKRPNVLKSGRHSESFYKELWETITSGRVWQGEIVNRRKDGSLYYEEQTITPVLGKRGEITHFIGIKNDVSKRHASEEALRQSERKFKSLAENSPNMIFINSYGKVVYVNKRCEEVMGYSREEFYEDHFDFRNLVASEHHAQLENSIRKHNAGLFVEPTEYKIVTKNGVSLDSLISTRLIDFEGGSAILGIITDVTQTKSVMKALRRSEETFRKFLEDLGDLAYMLDEEGMITYANKAAEEIVGIPRKEALGTPLAPLLDEKSRKLFARVFPRVLAGESIQVEITFLNGRTCQVRGNPLRGSQNRIVGVFGVGRDVTDQKNAETALMLKAKQQEATAEFGHTALIERDRSALLNTAAQVIARTLDVTFSHVLELDPDRRKLVLKAGVGWPKDLIGKTTVSLSEDIEAGQIVIPAEPAFTERLFRQGSVCEMQFYPGQKIENGLSVTVEGNGLPYGVLGISHSEQRAFSKDDRNFLQSISNILSASIRRLENESHIAELATLLDQATDAIAVCNSKGCITYWNRGAEKLYGWPRNFAIGKNAATLLFASDLKTWDGVLANITSADTWTGEFSQKTKDGRDIQVEANWSWIKEPNHSENSILIINRDVTEKKILETQFIRGQRMESIGTLAGGVAHDLNNMLTPIMMSVECLKRTIRDDGGKKMIDLLERSAKRGAETIRQILTFSRGLGGQKMELQPRYLLKEIENIIRDTFPKSISISVNVPKDVKTIEVDTTQIHQVLLNLCINARDAMEKGGILSIDAQNVDLGAKPRGTDNGKKGLFVCISVSDTGTGIAPENLSRIFEPFFTTKELNKGTGLGLSTVNTIVKSHGGFVEVESSLEKGTTFRVFLPAAQPAIKQHQRTHNGTPPAGSDELILVVDDEQAICHIATSTLDNYGYKAISFNRGFDAVELLKKRRTNVQAIIVDMMMPVMDGPATIRAIKRIEPAVKIIAVSGAIDLERTPESVGLQVDAFLPKPFTAEALLTTLRNVLSKRKKGDQPRTSNPAS